MGSFFEVLGKERKTIDDSIHCSGDLAGRRYNSIGHFSIQGCGDIAKMP
jgi:hypothetical protein